MESIRRIAEAGIAALTSSLHLVVLISKRCMQLVFELGTVIVATTYVQGCKEKWDTKEIRTYVCKVIYLILSPKATMLVYCSHLCEIISIRKHIQDM